MAVIRRQEAQQAAIALQASLRLLSFPDMWLQRLPFETLIETVLPILREINPDVLFSFNPENQPFIDHPDHWVTGMLAKYVGAALNVLHLMPESPAPAQRPQLYLWTHHTTATEERIHSLPLTKNDRKKHNDYLKKFHPSQFQATDEQEWIALFERISREKNNKHSERYIKIR